MSSSGANKVPTYKEVEYLIRARYPLIYIVSYEEYRVETKLKSIAMARDKKLFIWSSTEGMRGVAGAGGGGREIRDPLKALDYILDSKEDAIFVLRDYHPYLKVPDVVRKLRDVRHELGKTYKTCILLSPVQVIPTELEKELAVVDWELPGKDAMRRIMERILQAVDDKTRETILGDPALLEAIPEAALGLTEVEAESVFAKSLVQKGELDINIIHSEKEQIIRKAGMLEFLKPTENIAGIGGLDQLKDWLRKRSKAFSKEAREFGIPEPKGILLIGIPGCGKSLTAKAIGAFWKRPLLRLDVGKVFGSLVGSSEENIRKATKVAESVAPSILWLDELEKGLAGVQSSGQSDAGTAARVFGTFITWLQEKQSPVFVIATANNVKMLPPELLRKGRFDEIFFVDLPSPSERRKIFDIHLKKRNRDPELFDIDALVEASEGFSGSEAEQAIISALYDSFDADEEVRTEHILHSIEETVPLSQTMQEDITDMRDWAKTRARLASLEYVMEAAKGTSRKLEL